MNSTDQKLCSRLREIGATLLANAYEAECTHIEAEASRLDKLAEGRALK